MIIGFLSGFGDGASILTAVIEFTEELRNLNLENLDPQSIEMLTNALNALLSPLIHLSAYFLENREPRSSIVVLALRSLIFTILRNL